MDTSFVGGLIDGPGIAGRPRKRRGNSPFSLLMHPAPMLPAGCVHFECDVYTHQLAAERDFSADL